MPKTARTIRHARLPLKPCPGPLLVTAACIPLPCPAAEADCSAASGARRSRSAGRPTTIPVTLAGGGGRATVNITPFWAVIDHILNAILFLLIGLEVLVLRVDPKFGWLALVAIPIVLFARLVAVAVPVQLFSLLKRFAGGTIPVLTWGGVRGGISVALALLLPESPERPIILAATYTVVVCSIVVQGLTLGWVVRRTVGQEP